MRSILTALQEGRLFELPDADKDRSLEFLARILDANPDIEVGTDAIEEVKKRELQCNTGIGQGVAVPHVRARRDEGELFCAIGWSPRGLVYGAEDGKDVHLVFMYYIPAAQKNVYLKEISSLVKAIRISGGVGSIAHAADLNAVRNLLLDWVSEVLREAGPEAVARMIKLEVKHAQSPPPVAPVPVPAAAPAPLTIAGGRALSFSVLVLGSNQMWVLTQDTDWMGVLERDQSLPRKLAAGTPFVLAGRQVFLLGTSGYAGGRVLYQCVSIANAG